MNRKIFAFLLALSIPYNFYGSVDFDGSDDYLECGSVTTSAGDGALAAWIKIDPSVSIVTMIVISFGTADAPTLQMGIAQSAADVTKFATYCNAYLPESGGNKDITADCPAAQCINTNQWYHIACVDSSGGGTLTPYINGVAYTGATGEGVEIGVSHELVFANDTFLSFPYYKGEIADGVFVDGVTTTSDIETMAFSRMRNYVYPTDSYPKKLVYFPLDDYPDGTSLTSKTFIDRTGNGNSCAARGGGTARADILRYP